MKQPPALRIRNRINLELLDPYADPGGAKMTHKYRKSKEFLCFVKVLDVLF
jgi:hypothetical protein